jgi:hypothetical protein
MCQGGVFEQHLREASVSEVITVYLDVAKHVFHVLGVDDRGQTIFGKRIRRGKLLDSVPSEFGTRRYNLR